MITPLDSQHLPAVIGACVHCGLPLYASAPVSHAPGLAHVACALDALRPGRV